MLVLNPKDRISIPEILSHPWLIDNEELFLQDDMLDVQGKSQGFPMQGFGSTPDQEPDINQV